MIKKVSSLSEIKPDDLKDLEVLLADRVKEYVTIGKSYYEIYPTQALVLLEVISDILDILTKSKSVKYEKLKLEDPELWEKLGEDNVIVTINDILSIPENINAIVKILHKVLEGVDEDDFKSMTIQQITQILSKLIKVNLDSFPESFKNNFKNLLENPTGENISNITNEVKNNIETMKSVIDANKGENVGKK